MYKRQSLRRIAKEASVTTGAIYGYFAGKDALFAALTEDAAEELVELYTKVHSDFASLPPEEQPAMLNVVTEECVPWLVNYIYDHFEAFKLLLCCGAPGCGERFFDRLAEVEDVYKRQRSALWTMLRLLVVLLIAIVVLFPVYIMVITSFTVSYTHLS